MGGKVVCRVGWSRRMVASDGRVAGRWRKRSDARVALTHLFTRTHVHYRDTTHSLQGATLPTPSLR
jgi:hypothetical protein